VIIQGSNMAEAHPVGFQWVMEAKARGAKVIHIDPRFTRTSAVADAYVPIRAGSDIAFLGGVVNYILTNEKDFREYVVAYTNASYLVTEGFQDTEDLSGLFSGYDNDTATYDTRTWQYEGMEPTKPPGSEDNQEAKETASGLMHESGGPHLEGDPKKAHTDPTLQHPRCVYQVLKRHFARYTPEMVEQVCGVPTEQFLQVCEDWTANSGRERTTAVVYAVGWTQHSVGVQYIRTAAIIQLLLGNMGRPGGGIMAMRGHASIQGSTDIPTLFNILPGYMPMPTAGTHTSLEKYLDSFIGDKQKGFWRNADAYFISLMKEYWGDAATKDNDYCYDYLPRLTGDHGTYRTVMDMIDGKISGYFLLGQNPAVGSAHGKLQRLGMANLDWLVVRDLALIESATWWKDSPEIATGEIVPEECRTEVFFFPAAAHTEKEGTFTQTQRMLQWREKAVDPKGDQRSELWFFYQLGRILRERLKDSTDPRDKPLQDLNWNYEVHGDEPSADSVLKAINGYDLTTGRLVNGYLELKNDGSTSCGCWIYSGVYAGGVNQADRRKPRDPDDPTSTALEWGWVWPYNRRILYNRASADPAGRPWSERKKYVWWDEEKQEWTGRDVPDFEKTKPPSYEPPDDAVGPAALRGDDPFVMQADGKGWLYAPSGLQDGPMPTHYEPHESMFANPLYEQQSNPTRKVYGREDNPSNPSPHEGGDPEIYPYVLTTSRLTEHHTAGGMSRQLPYLSELQPSMFIEVSPELAAERGLEHLGWATVVTSRSAIEARVLVTDRLAPLRVAGRVLHQVWAPYHWGSVGVVRGDSTNDLFGVALDPNVLIQESKVATCDVRPGRRPHGPELVELVDGYRQRAGVTVETGTFGATVGGLRKAHLEPDARGPQPGHHAGTQSGPSMRDGGVRASEGTTANLRSGSEEGQG
jgi:formate dehydrogenase major subunit